MKIKFLGAAGTVTGSSYILTSQSGKSIMIDLGMFQGLPEVEKLNYLPLDFDCRQLIGVILTHAHLDHCGRLPLTVQAGYRGDIWMTPATRELTELSLFDSAKIAKQDDKEVLYGRYDVEDTISLFKTVDYHKPVEIGDFTVTFVDAGHLLGSASVEIVERISDTESKTIIFSGDLGNIPPDLLQNTEIIPHADIVVMEATYGDRLHPNEEALAVIQNEINAIESSQATLLIPAFSLERTQELLHAIMHLKKSGVVASNTPVYLDSPMAQKATLIYQKYIPLFNDHVQEDFNNGDPFNFPGLEIISTREQSQSISYSSGAKVIIAGSGMMSGGRIVGHAARFLPIATTRLLLAGYQGEGTLGRQLEEGAAVVTIDGRKINVAATVTKTGSMSSHADQQQLFDWLQKISGVKQVVLTHGEEEPRAVFAEKIKTETDIKIVVLPTLNEEVEL